MAFRACLAIKDDGQACRAPPLHDSEFCLMHSPEHAEEVAESRKRGRLRQRREQAVATAYDFEGLDTVDGIRRVFEIATIDGMALDNTVARCRLLIAAGSAAVKLLEVGELEDRVEALEAVLGPRLLATKSNDQGRQGRRGWWKRR